MEPKSGKSSHSPTPSGASPSHSSKPQPSSPRRTKAKQAMAALEQKQYGKAIALLKPLIEQTTKPSTQAQLQKALVKAYKGQGSIDRAMNLCQTLQQHRDPAVQKWATNAIDHLKKRYPDAIPTPTPLDATGFSVRTPPQAAKPTETAPEVVEDTQVGQDTQIGQDRKQETVEETDAFAPSSDLDAPTPTTDFFKPISSTPKASAPARSTPTPAPPSPPSTQPLTSDSAPSKRPDPAPSVSPSLQPTLQTIALQTLPWTQADRAKRWSPLKPKVTMATQIRTLLVHGWTAIALWWLATIFLQWGMAIGNLFRGQIEVFILMPRWFFLETHPGWVAGLVVLGLLVLSPWLLDLLLRVTYRAKPLTMADLVRYSKEAKTVLEKSSRQHRHSLPSLRLLPTQTPVLMSYGLLPRVSRIVVSEGLLRQLNEDELATLYGAELNHIRHWNLALMTGVTLSAQVSYALYQLFSAWGGGGKNGFLQWIGGTLAAIAYGMFWLVRGSGLWLARTRIAEGDRMAANITGNPNGLTRALLKVAIATATDIRRQGYTAPLLERFEWLMPVGYRSAISAGSIFPVQWQMQSHHLLTGVTEEATNNVTDEVAPAFTPPAPTVEATLLEWEYRNPHRDWLSVNNTHPPLGDRLYALAQQAKHWRLSAEVEVPSRSRLSPSRKWNLQLAPFMGFPFGAAIALILWIVGVVADQFDFVAIDWLEYDSYSIFWGMLAMGFSFGTILRINEFFPDIKPSTKTDAELAELLTNSEAIPVESQTIQLEGKLLGRKGVDNWLNQDLILQTQTGLIRLHCISMLGTFGHLIFNVIRLQPLKGRTVTVTGWLRRGATPWIDVDTIKTQRGSIVQSGHPIWSTFLASVLAIWGAYVMYQGNL